MWDRQLSVGTIGDRGNTAVTCGDRAVIRPEARRRELGASVYAEVMVRSSKAATRPFDGFLDAAKVTIIDVDRPLARRAGQLRARRPSMRLGDALSLAGRSLWAPSFDQRLRGSPSAKHVLLNAPDRGRRLKARRTPLVTFWGNNVTL
jgi:hypothetical protein